MKALLWAVSSLYALGATSAAYAISHHDLSENLSLVIASEKPCNLSYDQDAIAAFIEENVAADDFDFAGDLARKIRLNTHNVESVTASALTAHCAQISRVAKSYGFIK